MLLAFLIPAYKRPGGALRAAKSILEQCSTFTKTSVSIWINDDCSPGFSVGEVNSQLATYGNYADLRVTKNVVNLGMSANILMMVDGVTADFWSVLTDDDILMPNSLSEILSVLSAATILELGAVVTPRYCFDADGSFLFKTKDSDTLYPSIIQSGMLSSIKNLKHAHVLTGCFVKSGLDRSLWRRHIKNAYFPMLNFGSVLFNHSCLAIDRPWFVHTVFNITHWDEWGATDCERETKTNSDYLICFALILDLILKQKPCVFQQYMALRYYFEHSLNALCAMLERNGLLYAIRIISSLPIRPSFIFLLYILSLFAATFTLVNYGRYLLILSLKKLLALRGPKAVQRD
jgi:glycosyltransferase involved in cell wall biosynthesis